MSLTLNPCSAELIASIFYLFETGIANAISASNDENCIICP